MRAVFLALIVLLTSVAAASATDAGSNAWIDKRIGLWEKVCLKPVLRGASFKSAATSAGFAAAGGQYVYGKTEITASRSGSGNGCACLFSFGTTAPDKAASRLISRLAAAAGSKFSSDSNPKSVGTLKATGGSANVRVAKFKNAGAEWVGVTIIGRGVCAI